MITLTTAEAKKNFSNLVDDVSESHEPIQISGKRHSAVLVSEDDWRAIQETLYLVSVPGMRESIAKGLKIPVEKCRKEIKWWVGNSFSPIKLKKMPKNCPVPDWNLKPSAYWILCEKIPIKTRRRLKNLLVIYPARIRGGSTYSIAWSIRCLVISELSR